MKTSVPVGPTSVFGWVGGFLGLVPTIVADVEAGEVAFSGPQKYTAVAGIVLLGITQIGRYLQAHKLVGGSASEVVDKVDSLAETAKQELETVVMQIPKTPDTPPTGQSAARVSPEANDPNAPVQGLPEAQGSGTVS